MSWAHRTPKKLRLDVHVERPLMTWHNATESGRPVSVVRWCRSRPSVFFVVDSDSFLYIWDLNMDESSALKSERITQQSRSLTVTTLSPALSSLLTKGKGKAGIAVHGTPSHSYGVSLAIWDHTVLPATRHNRAHPAFTPASQPVLDLPTPEGWKAELT